MTRRLDLEYEAPDRLLATFDVLTTAAVITAFSAAALGDTFDRGFTILNVSYEVRSDQDLVSFEDSGGARHYRRKLGTNRENDPAEFTFKILIDSRFDLKTAMSNFYDWISTIARIEGARCELSVPLSKLPDSAPDYLSTTGHRISV